MTQPAQAAGLRAYGRALAALKRDTRIFLVATALYAIGFPGISTVLLGLYILRLGFDLPFVGIVIGSGQLAAVLMALPAGWVGRRFGLRTSLILGLVGTALGAAAMFSVELAPKPLWGAWLIGWWIVLFFPATLYFVNGVPYLMGVSEPAERSHAFSFLQGLQGFGAFTGSLLAGVLVDLLSRWPVAAAEPAAPYRYALFGIVASIVAAALVMSRTGRMPEDQRDALPADDAAYGSSRAPAQAPEPRQSRAAPISLFIWFGLVVVLESTGVGARTFFSVYLDKNFGIPAVNIGVVMGLALLLAVFAALLAPLVIKRLGTALTVGLATLGAALSMLMMALLPVWLAAAAAQIGTMVCLALAYPARNMLGQESVSARWRTSISAISLMGSTLAMAGMNLTGGYFIAVYGFNDLFLLGGILVAASAVLMLAYWRWHAARAGVSVFN